ncbi:hypothetical protein FNF27_04613 [Cafeteria roenbergensis]|uniref:Uncharacterized protein n=1 Tax=Cafeteria roenbergensis TaxID=33653 RepID=A0A5A8E808_CAFRO|nr:hypothetical protein FNF27_04613 [Cafeteria roenbergensis]
MIVESGAGKQQHTSHVVSRRGGQLPPSSEGFAELWSGWSGRARTVVGSTCCPANEGLAPGPAAGSAAAGMAYPSGEPAAAAAAAVTTRPSDSEPELVKLTRQLVERLGSKALTSVVAADIRASVGKATYSDMLARAGGRTFKLALQKLAPSAFVFGPHSIELAAPSSAAAGESTSGSELPRAGTTTRRVLDAVVQELKRFQGDEPGRWVQRAKVEEAATHTLSARVLSHAASEAGVAGPLVASDIAQRVAPGKVEVMGHEIRLVGDPPPASDVPCIVPEIDDTDNGQQQLFPGGTTLSARDPGSELSGGPTTLSVADAIGRALGARDSADPGPGHADADPDEQRAIGDLLPKNMLESIDSGPARPSPTTACLEVGRAVEAALLGSSSNSMLLAQLGPLIKSTVSPDRYQLACQTVRSRKMSEVIARIGKEDVTVEPQVGTGAVVVWSTPDALSRMINRLRKESDAAAEREGATVPLSGLSLAPGEFATSATQLGIGKLAWMPGTNEDEALVLGAAYRGLLERPCRADGSRCRDVGDLGNRVIQLIGRPAYLRGTRRYKLGALISSQGGPHIRVATRPGALEAEDAVIDFPSDEHVQPARDDPVARPELRVSLGFAQPAVLSAPKTSAPTKSVSPPNGDSRPARTEMTLRAAPGPYHAAAAEGGSGVWSQTQADSLHDRAAMWRSESGADLVYSKDLAFHYHMTLTEKEDGWVSLGDLLRESPPHATLSEDPIVILLKQGAIVRSSATGVRVKF